MSSIQRMLAYAGGRSEDVLPAASLEIQDLSGEKSYAMPFVP